MSRIYYCDVCREPITDADNVPWPYLRAEYGGMAVVLRFEKVTERLGWPIDICAKCLRHAIQVAEWVDPAEKPMPEAER